MRTLLPALLPRYREAVDVIYIDPPYNTGNKDFIYNDSFVDKEDPWRHSKWLSFMKTRLRLAKLFLKDTGVIFVSIDDNEFAQLKMLLDETFGEENHLATIIYDGGLKNNAHFVSVGHDYMLAYAKSKDSLVLNNIKWREEKKGLQLFKAFINDLQNMNVSLIEKQKKLNAWLKSNKNELDKGLLAYHHIDDHGVYRRGDISAPGGNGKKYEVLHPVTGKPVKPPSGGWRYSEETMREKIANREISFGADESTVPAYLRRLSDDGANDKQIPRSYFWAERANANRMLQKILGKNQFDFPKDVNVIKRWINLACPNQDAIIMDFFAGSGTTGHAVALLNTEDGGSRKAILVTNNENGIAENVTVERMKRALTGREWADGKPHPDLKQGLTVSEVQLLEQGSLAECDLVYELACVNAPKDDDYYIPDEATLAKADHAIKTWSLAKRKIV